MLLHVNLKARCYCTMLMFNYIADINCLVSCGGLDNENPEVRKARYEILLVLSLSVVKFELIIFLLPSTHNTLR
jgi:hypothetical protein